MNTIPRMLVSATLAAGLSACGSDAPAPDPGPTPASAERLRPLTSREGSTPPSLAPTAEATLPPGHPPVSGDASGEARPGVPGGPSAGQTLSGTVVLAAKLQGRHSPTDTLFLIVRSAASGQILAVRKEEGPRFPFAFQISAADAMTEGTEFAGPFDITARLSKTGDALPATGDLEGTAKKVADGAKAVSISLDSVRP
jgi:cytochrome c-type biogenesis protein CcmH